MKKLVIIPGRDYWLPDELARIEEAGREAEREARRKTARFARVAKKVLLVEFTVVGFEALYRLGGLIRGYNSFGGESMLILAALAVYAYWQHKK